MGFFGIKTKKDIEAEKEAELFASLERERQEARKHLEDNAETLVKAVEENGYDLTLAAKLMSGFTMCAKRMGVNQRIDDDEIVLTKKSVGDYWTKDDVYFFTTVLYEETNLRKFMREHQLLNGYYEESLCGLFEYKEIFLLENPERKPSYMCWPKDTDSEAPLVKIIKNAYPYKLEYFEYAIGRSPFGRYIFDHLENWLDLSQFDEEEQE